MGAPRQCGGGTVGLRQVVGSKNFHDFLGRLHGGLSSVARIFGVVAPSSEPEERPRSGEAIGKKIERAVSGGQTRVGSFVSACGQKPVSASGQFHVRLWAFSCPPMGSFSCPPTACRLS